MYDCAQKEYCKLNNNNKNILHSIPHQLTTILLSIVSILIFPFKIQMLNAKI